MDYRETLPSLPLARFIKCFWALEYRAAKGTAEAEPVLPDGSPEIVFNLSDRFLRLSAGREDLQPATLFAGQMTRGILIRPTAHVKLFGVRFQPAGAFPFLRAPLDETTDEIVEFGDAVASGIGKEIEERIHSATCFDERIAIFESYFSKSLREIRKTDAFLTASKAVAVIEEQGGRLSVPDIADELGVSERSLERRFKQAVGIAPKTFSRIARFQTVVRAFQSGKTLNLLDTALDCGYYDQSHLNRDFNEFAGQSPTAFFERTHRISDIFTGAA